MENNQQSQQNTSENVRTKNVISIGAALVLGFSGIIMAAIIAAAIMFSSSTKVIDNIDFENFDGLTIQVDENGHSTNIDVRSEQRTSPGDPIPGYESCPPFCDSIEDANVNEEDLNTNE